MKRRICFALIACLLYLALISFVPLLDRLVLFPSTAPIDAAGAARRTIAVGSGEVEMWTAASSKARAAGRTESYVLRFYGNADRPERWVAAEAEMFEERALEVWGVNYPGFGGSTGPARLAHVGPAALAAFDAIKRAAGDRPIIIFGTSFGTIAALHIAAQRPVAGLILQNPPALREMILRDFGWWNLWLLAGPLSQKVPAALDSIANAKIARARAVFLLAEKDEVVAPRFQALVADAYAGEKRVVTLAGARHNDPLGAAEMVSLQRAIDWLIPLASSESRTQE